MIELIKNQHIMVGESEEDYVPLYEIVNDVKMKDSKFVELLNYYINTVAKGEEEHIILKTAFNMYSVGYIDINLRQNLNDKRSVDKYKRAKKSIAQLFDEIESLVPENTAPYPDTQMRDNEVLEYIDQKIGLLLTTRTVWKKAHRNNAEYHLTQNNIKEYRHKDIFVAFHKIISDYEASL